MMSNPRVCVLKADGTNCDEETRFAFLQAGANAQIVLMSELRDRRVNLGDFQILVIPGGFSYGDDIASGKVFATELVTFLKDDLAAFIAAQKPIIGICNGFQVLVQSGLLPGGTLGTPQIALAHNSSGRFDCRPTRLRCEEGSNCIWLAQLDSESIFSFPIAHGEGRLWASDALLHAIEAGGQAVLRYVDSQGNPALTYPDNPNGAMNNIAGICDTSGRIFGLMPHPERACIETQDPNWRRTYNPLPLGHLIFKAGVQYVRDHL